jgi:hypothetical protein
MEVARPRGSHTENRAVVYFIPGKVHVDIVLITAGTDEILENFPGKLIPLFSVFSRGGTGSSVRFPLREIVVIP